VGHAKLGAQLAQNLLRIAQGQDRQSLIATIFALKARFGWVEQQPPAREQPLGKKDARLEAVRQVGTGSWAWDDLVQIRTPQQHKRERWKGSDEEMN